MRKIVIGAALALTTALLAGCGSDGDSSKDSTSDKADKAVSTSGKPTADGAAESASDPVKREVTLEVRGTGSSQIYYNLDTNKMETVTLPWKKTSTLSLTTEAEKKVGLAVSVAPGSVADSGGTLRPADCVITVDGKKVADNRGGKSTCQYTVK
ncbi:hypothetical protein [Streptomyces sp. NPDC057702]|uniref:hypothetical protein n=1 Tax=unclassified Streptomyces TaxID=2593676 RepID=UPI0036A6FA63